MADQSYQSLYRRYRPQRFSEVKGQDHVTRALRNAARDDRVAHAYLFSGPRGTGKTSTARILAKVLNCPNQRDGEPCGTCDSCVQVALGASFDVHELDAASNNGVEAMRDLVARAALGTPGRWKVYIVDEVHMLSTAASNALLKTLEEPPGHVVFVLATTDPQRVLPTIRSRTQHFEFRLLTGDALADLVRHVQDDAGLDLPSEAVDLAVRRGNGSARDALSVLDQIAAAGTVDDSVAVLDELMQAITERDAGRALVAVAEACAAGWDAQRLATDLVEQLRWGFLATMAPTLVPLTDAARQRVDEQGRQLGPAALVRGVELVGQALVDMRDALDPRATLEVALVRLARPDADHSPEALLERIEGLERRLSSRGPATPPGGSSPAAPPQPKPEPSAAGAPPAAGGGDPGGKAALGAVRRQARTPGDPPGNPGGGAKAAPPAQDAAPGAGRPPPSVAVGQPDRDELVKAWGDSVLSGLKGRARARFRAGRFVAAQDGVATFALPDEIHRSYSEECRVDVEAALRAHFGVPIRLRLVVDDDSPSVPASQPARQAVADDPPDPDELTDAPPGSTSVEARLLQTFPGAREVPGMTAPPGPDR
ncbi:MAG TPA: DNA polymerase III subunit gamma/tau [Acidimicrobiales bacterium]|nr:DNA polymerase III subunit gamma/tau [Acidimicrobiales bacterium]